jgi:hypothetical protein
MPRELSEASRAGDVGAVKAISASTWSGVRTRNDDGVSAVLAAQYRGYRTSQNCSSPQEGDLAVSEAGDSHPAGTAGLVPRSALRRRSRREIVEN